MAVKDVLIKVRNALNSGWDTILPITSAENVLINPQAPEQGSVMTHMAGFASYQFGDRPYVSTEDKTYYLDGTNGNDDNDGLTESTAFKTWKKLWSEIPRVIHHVYNIDIIGNYTGDIVITDVNISREPDSSLTGRLFINGNTGVASNHQINGRVLFYNVFGPPEKHYLSAVRVLKYISVADSFTSIINCEPRDTTNICGIYVVHSSVNVKNCDFGTNIVNDGITAEFLATVFSENNVGVARNCGLLSACASIIGKKGSQVTGSSNEYSAYGGVIR